MMPQKAFNSGGLVVAIFELNYMGWGASGLSEVEKIGISRYDREAIRRSKFPDTFVGGKLREPGCKNVSRSWEKPLQAQDELRRKVRIK